MTHALRERGTQGVQGAVVALYRSVGCEVLTFPETRRSRIRMPAGWPDLFVLAPLRYLHDAQQGWGSRPAFWFHEVKTSEGELSDVQEVMHDKLRFRGIPVIVGGEDVARKHLQDMGILRVGA